MTIREHLPEYFHKDRKDERYRSRHMPKPPDGSARFKGSALRDHVPFHGVLPRYSGPYGVGTIDIEVPVRKPRGFQGILPDQPLPLETVLMTIYYPAQLEDDEQNIHRPSRRARRPQWLVGPRSKTAKGYGRSVELPGILTLSWFFCTTWFTQLPAYKDALLADHWPPPNTAGNTQQKRKPPKAELPEGVDGPPIFPLIMFSHGLCGTRRSQSAVCGEFASFGFIVCALEHRDGSGPSTVVHHVPEVLGGRLRPDEHEGDERSNSKATYDNVKFMFASSDAHDTRPGHHVDHDMRNAQIEFRIAEIEEAFEVMKIIQRGEGQTLVENNLKSNTVVAGENIDWAAWKDRFHIDHVTVAGHSFGAATSSRILREKETLPECTQAIIYDTWALPYKPAAELHEFQMHGPILAINSEAFMSWPANFDIVKGLMAEAQSTQSPAWMTTVRGTVHPSQTDFCLLYPHASRWLLKSIIDPIRAIDLNVEVSLDFLSRVLDLGEQPFTRSLSNKKILDQEILHKLPTVKGSGGKWLAIRPPVSQKATHKLTPEAKKKYWRDELGEAAEQEVWVHVAPGTNAETSRPSSGNVVDRDGSEHKPVT